MLQPASAPAQAVQAASVWAIRPRLDQAQCLDVLDESRRDGAAVERALAALGEAARPYAVPGAARPALMPLVVDAVRARASVGEISDALAHVWGRYRPSA